MPVAIRLDARDMVPPEPFDRATAILQGLKPGQYLHMVHRRIPYPLFEFSQGLSLAHAVNEQAAPECYDILIYFPVDEQDLRQAGVL